MIRVKEHSSQAHFFEAHSNTLEIKADSIRPVVVVRYNVQGRNESFLLTRDPLLIGELADALSLLHKQLMGWEKAFGGDE